MALVVHVEAVISGMVLQVGHETGDIDDRHNPHSLPRLGPDSAFAWSRACHHRWCGRARRARRSGGGGSDLARRPRRLGARRHQARSVLQRPRRRPGRRRGVDRARASACCPRSPVDIIPTGRSPWWSIPSTGRRTHRVGSLGTPPACARWTTRARWRRSSSTSRAEPRSSPSATPAPPSTAKRCGRRRRRPSRESLVALSGFPGQWLGWYQYRALGAAALDLCAVASGVVDAYIDCSWDAHGPWDYLGGMLVCTEAGGVRGRCGRPIAWSCSNTMLAARRSPPATRRCSREVVRGAPLTCSRDALTLSG